VEITPCLHCCVMYNYVMLLHELVLASLLIILLLRNTAHDAHYVGMY
jgi:hypothetical protein